MGLPHAHPVVGTLVWKVPWPRKHMFFLRKALGVHLQNVGMPWNWGAQCRVKTLAWGVLCGFGVRCAESVLGTVGEALGNYPRPVAKSTAVETNRIQGPGPPAGDNGQERKCVQALLWMWSSSGTSFSIISRKTEKKPGISCFAHCGVLNVG